MHPLHLAVSLIPGTCVGNSGKGLPVMTQTATLAAWRSLPPCRQSLRFAA